MGIVNKSIIKDLNSPNKEIFEEAFNALYNEYSYLTYFVSLKIVRDCDLAKEITNETFYQFLLHKNQIDIKKNIKYYLVSTSKNLSLNALNKQNRIEELNDTFTYEEKKDGFNDYIEMFKDLLNSEEIELIVYHFLYDFTFKEIAKEKNVSVSIISSKYFRTINKVKKYYKGETFNEKFKEKN